MRPPAAGRTTFDNWVAAVGELSPDQGPSPQLALTQTCLTAAAEIWGLQRPSGKQSSVNNTKNNLRGLWHHIGCFFFLMAWNKMTEKWWWKRFVIKAVNTHIVLAKTASKIG